jgi:hypothetical protein
LPDSLNKGEKEYDVLGLQVTPTTRWNKSRLPKFLESSKELFYGDWHGT